MADGRGGKRPGAGRPLGSKNKLSASKARERVALAKQACDYVGIDPFQTLAEFAANTEDPQLAFNAAKELCKYIAPQLKTVSLQPTDGAPIAQIVLNLNGQETKVIDQNGHREQPEDIIPASDLVTVN